jgi:hypothetical protein
MARHYDLACMHCASLPAARTRGWHIWLVHDSVYRIFGYAKRLIIDLQGDLL